MRNFRKTGFMGRVINLTAILTLLALSFCIMPPQAVFAADKTITILHTNDSHGRMVNTADVIGIDTIAGIKGATPNSLLVDAGDTLHGLPFVTLQKGKDAIELMNIAGYDLFTPGNHDFNYGYETLLELVEGAEFDVISANVKKDGEPIFDSIVVKEVDGVKIGFFGLTSPETTYKTNPLNVQGLIFDNIIDCAISAVTELQEQEVDVIVGLVHLGNDAASFDISAKLALYIPEIDVIIDGHSHSLYENGLFVNGVLIASSKEYEKYVGCVEITVDSQNNVQQKTASQINYETAMAEYEADEDVSKRIEEIVAKQDETLGVVVAEIGNTLSAAREPGVRTQEMPIGNLVADALKEATDAAVAFTNGGGLRADLEEGEVTRGDIVAVLPFGNYCVTKFVTAVELKALMENGVASAPESAGKFPQISGFTVTFDSSLPAGERVVEITIDGEAIDMTDDSTEYLLATNDFIAVGGDEYTTLLNIPTENEYSALDELLLQYMNNNPDIEYVDVEGRIVDISE